MAKNNKVVEKNSGVLGNEAENRGNGGEKAAETTVVEDRATKIADQNRIKKAAAEDQRKATEKVIEDNEARKEAERLLEESRLGRLAAQNQALGTTPSVEQPGGVGNMASNTPADNMEANLPGPAGGEQRSFGQGLVYGHGASGSGQTSSFGAYFANGEKWLDNIDYFCKKIFSTPRIGQRN